MRHKIFLGLLVFLLVFSFTLTNAAAKDQYIRLGCGGPGGSWFQMVGGLSSLFNKDIDGVNVSAVSAGGSVALMRLIRKGELEATFTHTLTAYDSWNGVGKFKRRPYEGYPDDDRYVRERSSLGRARRQRHKGHA